MKYIKKIYNDSKELTDKYIILAIISLVLIMLKRDYFASRIIDLLAVGLPMAYFIYIKTNSGKRNFNKLNKIVSVIVMLICAYNIFTFISKILPAIFDGAFNSLLSILSVLSFILSILFYLYWISVFFLNDEQRKKIFKDKFNSDLVCKTLIVAQIVVVVLYRIIIINKFGFVVQVTISSLLSLLLTIMQIRYVALYQKFKEGKGK